MLEKERKEGQREGVEDGGFSVLMMLYTVHDDTQSKQASYLALRKDKTVV